ncbi:MAG: hypothetical protein ACTSQY_01995 [Candidatus Odinarchaeia archaeon]
MVEEELYTTEIKLNQLPATILNLFGLNNPAIPKPADLTDVTAKRYQQIILILLDNFGLFECIYYKPKFLIVNSKAMILLDTTNPFSDNIINNIIFADEGKKDGGFKLPVFLKEQNLTSVMIGGSGDIRKFDGMAKIVTTENDTQTYVQSIKVLNRYNFIWLHFLDFEKMYSKYNFQPPTTTAQKLITRTDNWILTLYKQLKTNSMMIIVGTHGKKEIEMGYEGHFKELRGASVPIAILIEK